MVWQTRLPEDWSAIRVTLANETQEAALYIAGLSLGYVLPLEQSSFVL